MGHMEIAADRQHDPVSGMRDPPTFRRADLHGAGLGHGMRVIPQPGPELVPVAGVVGRRDAKRSAVVKSRIGTGGPHREEIRRCVGDQILNTDSLCSQGRRRPFRQGVECGQKAAQGRENGRP